MIESGLIPESKMEKSKEIINHFKNNEINIIYYIGGENNIHIFVKNFVEKNKDKCKIEFENKEYELKEYFNIKDYTDNKLEKLQIKLKYINKITDMSYMFSGCESLAEIPEMSEWNTNNVTDMSYMFNDCKLIIELPDISKWNTNNVTNMNGMFFGCEALLSLPDISKWNTNNVTSMDGMFSFRMLSSLPDISKWNTNNVTSMNNMFIFCML